MSITATVKISLKVEYACRVMVELARLHGSGELAQIGALAKAESVPANFLAQILIKLREAGLILSRRGKQGGYTLARPPEEISLLDIVVAVEGDLLRLSGAVAGRSGRRLRQVWQEIGASLAEQMKAETLDRLCVKAQGEMYYI